MPRRVIVMKRKKETEAIKVVVRVRPPNAKEIQDKRVIITAAKEEQGIIEVRDPVSKLLKESDLERAERLERIWEEKNKQREW